MIKLKELGIFIAVLFAIIVYAVSSWIDDIRNKFKKKSNGKESKP